MNYHELARMALGFVLEDESWPVFLAWCQARAVSSEARDWLAAGPDLGAARWEWASHSPDPVLRAAYGMEAVDDTA